MLFESFNQGCNLPYILFMDGAKFARDDTINAGNSHSYIEKNPHQVTPYHLQLKFSVNMWCGVSENNVIAPHVIERRLTALCYSSGKLLSLHLTGILSYNSYWRPHKVAPSSENNWDSSSDNIQSHEWQHAHGTVVGISNMCCNYKFQRCCKVEKKVFILCYKNPVINVSKRNTCIRHCLLQITCGT
jgi:hypothetical protein